MATSDGAAAPALKELCRAIREYSLFQAILQVIKRLRDAMGNQLVAELLVKNIARKGYMLSVPPERVRVD